MKVDQGIKGSIRREWTFDNRCEEIKNQSGSCNKSSSCNNCWLRLVPPPLDGDIDSYSRTRHYCTILLPMLEIRVVATGRTNNRLKLFSGREITGGIRGVWISLFSLALSSPSTTPPHHSTITTQQGKDRGLFTA